MINVKSRIQLGSVTTAEPLCGSKRMRAFNFEMRRTFASSLGRGICLLPQAVLHCARDLLIFRSAGATRIFAPNGAKSHKTSRLNPPMTHHKCFALPANQSLKINFPPGVSVAFRQIVNASPFFITCHCAIEHVAQPAQPLGRGSQFQ